MHELKTTGVNQILLSRSFCPVLQSTRGGDTWRDKGTHGCQHSPTAGQAGTGALSAATCKESLLNTSQMDPTLRKGAV